MAARIYLVTYTIQADWDADPIGSLEKIKEMGYEGVEFSLGVDDDTLEAISRRLKELELEAIATHIVLDDASANLDRYLSWMEKLGMRSLGIPWLDKRQLPGGKDYDETKRKLINLASILKEKGFDLIYHNHNLEFEKVNGVCKQDILLQDIPAMDAHLDVCWCTVGGQCPAEYIRHYGHRTKILHLKDFTASGEFLGEKLFAMLGNDDAKEAELTRKKSGFDFRPVGYGMVDFPAVFKAADEVGVQWMGVEQDASTERPPMEAARMSIDYIRKTYGK